MPTLSTLRNRSARQIVPILNAYMGAIIERQPLSAHRAAIMQTVGESRTLADLLGREWLTRYVGRRRGKRTHAEDSSRPVAMEAPTFEAAVRAILRRTPGMGIDADEVIANAAKAGVQFAKAVEVTLSDHAGAVIADTIASGFARSDAVEVLAADPAWSLAYANTVYRTNITAAYTDGIIEQSEAPILAGAVAGGEYSATGDVDTRANHAAADGFVARWADPAWRVLKPPLGFNCRCSVVPVMMADAVRRYGRDGIPLNQPIPRGAHPDRGFRRAG